VPRALSIHVGVNDPLEGGGQRLRESEASAWRMASLANQAGYDAIRMLRGEEATRQALRDALESAAGALRGGDILFLSFSGHGSQHPSLDGDDNGYDESWCLKDGVLLDNELPGFWRQFEDGVRILVVAECCYAAGMTRKVPLGFAWAQPEPMSYRDFVMKMHAPRDPDGIRASVLLLAACGEGQQAREGLFMGQLMEIWDNGSFRGSYIDLLGLLQQRLRPVQEPSLQMLGAPDTAFASATAFHREPTTACEPSAPGMGAPNTPTTPREPGGPAPGPVDGGLREPPVDGMRELPSFLRASTRGE